MPDLHPTVLWAQRKDKLYLTIDVQNCKDPQIKVENDDAAQVGHITFQGVATSHATGPEEHKYVLDLQLFGEIDADDVKQAITDRTITLVIAKKEEGPHWPRLLKAAGKAPQHVKADWDKWVDEDEEDEAEDPMAGMDFSQMAGGGMGGMMGGGGMGGAGGMPAGLEAMMAGMGGGMGGGMAGMPPGMQGFDLSQLGDLAAGAGDDDFGSDDEDGDDDDDLPPLEPAGGAA